MWHGLTPCQQMWPQKIATAKVRLQLGNTSSIKWFSGIGEYKIDYGAGWRIYLAKDGLEIIVLIGGGSKKAQQKDIDQALALWADYKQRKTQPFHSTNKPT